MVTKNTHTVRLPVLVTLVFVFIGFSSSLRAIEIKITPIDINSEIFEIILEDIDPIDGRVYTIDLGSGPATISFGNGIPGAIPPSGENNVVATYRYGFGGVDGTIIGIYPVLQNLLPVLIPFSDFVGTNNQEDVSFSLIGLAQIKFEISRAGMLVVESQSRAVPEPSNIVLMCIGLAGIGYRQNRKRRIL